MPFLSGGNWLSRTVGEDNFSEANHGQRQLATALSLDNAQSQSQSHVIAACSDEMMQNLLPQQPVNDLQAA